MKVHSSSVAVMALILAIDPILDMCRTSVNVWSDSCGAVVIATSEGESLTVHAGSRRAG